MDGSRRVVVVGLEGWGLRQLSVRLLEQGIRLMYGCAIRRPKGNWSGFTARCATRCDIEACLNGRQRGAAFEFARDADRAETSLVHLRSAGRAACTSKAVLTVSCW